MLKFYKHGIDGVNWVDPKSSCLHLEYLLHRPLVTDRLFAMKWSCAVFWNNCFHTLEISWNFANSTNPILGVVVVVVVVVVVLIGSPQDRHTTLKL